MKELLQLPAASAASAVTSATSAASAAPAASAASEVEAALDAYVRRTVDVFDLEQNVAVSSALFFLLSIIN